MCGIAGVFGEYVEPRALRQMVASQFHRGPDMQGLYFDPSGCAGLGHNRLSIIDLSRAGSQPMVSASGRFWIAFNGEIYNFRELREELKDYPFRTLTDTEVILAAWERWGEKALDRMLGMFAFLMWDEQEKRLTGVRDRFGVKPLYYALPTSESLVTASEITAFHAIGIGRTSRAEAWATYLMYGLNDHSEMTFWNGIHSLPPGHLFHWQSGRMETRCWYDIADRVGPQFDRRPVSQVVEEYEALLHESVRLRFRSDVKLGIAVSGGLDSSTLVGLIRQMQKRDGEIEAFTYVCGDPRYDELPWVHSTLERTRHPLLIVSLTADRVPELAASIQQSESEPFGGIPTLAYSLIFDTAREMGCVVLLDGQGMDEQWAGYDYYERAVNGPATGPVQGSVSPSLRPSCLTPDFQATVHPVMRPTPFPDALRNLQYWDIRFAKIPRALRFNDRISMRSSTELREPFLDHRLCEIALRQPVERKIAAGQRKHLLRRITKDLLPTNVVEAPKRPVQTPQREWLAGPLKQWARENIELALTQYGGQWLDRGAVRAEFEHYLQGSADNSFYVWQWISLGLTIAQSKGTHPTVPLNADMHLHSGLQTPTAS